MKTFIQILISCLITCIVTLFFCADMALQEISMQVEKANIHANDTAKYWNERYLKCNGEIKRDVEFLENLGK